MLAACGVQNKAVIGVTGKHVFDERRLASVLCVTPSCLQPAEVGPSYVFLASQEASYYTGQVSLGWVA